MSDETEEVFMSMLMAFTMRRNPINDPETHQNRVDAARTAMGTKYLCHPENLVRKVWRGPVRVEK